MHDVDSRTTLVVSLVATAAAIAIAAYLYRWRVRTISTDPGPSRGVNDLLHECNTRLREMQDHLHSAAASPG